jgi:hypothetical protein
MAASYLVTSIAAPVLTARHGRRVVAAGGLTLAAGHAVLLATVAEVGTTGVIFFGALHHGYTHAFELSLAALAALLLAVAGLSRLLPAPAAANPATANPAAANPAAANPAAASPAAAPTHTAASNPAPAPTQRAPSNPAPAPSRQHAFLSTRP